jgi:coenzyme PQQ synthesis protein D (PqqD)
MSYHRTRSFLTHGTRESLMHPKAKRTDIIAKEFDRECLLLDEQTLRVHELNATAASVWRHADGHRSIADLAAAMATDTGLPGDEEIVHLALAQLSQAGLLEDSWSDARISRRQITKRLGLTGGLALLLPLVSSIVAPTPAIAQSVPTHDDDSYS